MSTLERRARLILVDDHPAMMRQILRLLPDSYEIVDALDSGGALKQAVERHAPDLVLLDITLPGLSGIQLAHELRKTSQAKIIFLTVHSDPDYVREAFVAGATGYVVKSRMVTDLPLAVADALAGKHFISPCAELAGLTWPKTVCKK